MPAHEGLDLCCSITISFIATNFHIVMVVKVESTLYCWAFIIVSVRIRRISFSINKFFEWPWYP